MTSFKSWWDWYWSNEPIGNHCCDPQVPKLAYDAGRLSVLSQLSQNELVKTLNKQKKF
jgi:hypothetical protein